LIRVAAMLVVQQRNVGPAEIGDPGMAKFGLEVVLHARR
jgi:hypothetical protein